MAARPQIFIADWLYAVKALSIESEATARDVMRMLSLEVLHDDVPRHAAAAPDAPPPEPRTPPRDAAAPTADAGAGHGAAERAEPATTFDNDAAFLVTRLSDATAMARPAWAHIVEPMPRAVRARSPPPDPLLDPRLERALLSGLSSSLGHDGGLHVERLVEYLARAAVPHELPMEPSWSTRRGLHVLTDDGPGMAPFRGDIERVMARLAALLPGERLSRLAFEGCPTRGCRVRGMRGSRPWKAPERGSAVLLLTDLGIGAADPETARGTIGEWLEFANAAKVGGVQLRALVPYPAIRWPAALASRMHLISWDRRTSVAVVRRAVAAAERQVRA